MAWLKGPGEAPPVRLRATHFVGRDPSADLVIVDDRVSKDHARFDWNGTRWLLRDRGSTNGTSVDGGPPIERVAVPVDVGTVIRFADPQHTWTLIDAGPPVASAVDLDGVETVGTPSLLAIGPEDAPIALLTRAADEWTLEDMVTGERRTVGNRATVLIGGRPWILHLPGLSTQTSTVHVANLRLVFRVSLDEERVELEGRTPTGTVPLGTHAYHYLLLDLARQRLAERDPRDPEAGWVYQEDLLRRFKWTGDRLNLAVFRAREKAELAGIEEPERLIERRITTRQLRIGVADIEIYRG